MKQVEFEAKNKNKVYKIDSIYNSIVDIKKLEKGH